MNVPSGDPRRGAISTLGRPAATRQQVIRHALGGIIPSSTVDEFLSALPDPGIQQISFVEENFYSPDFPQYHELSIVGTQVPEQMVYVFTDVLFFGLVPGTGILAAPEFVPQPALNSYLRFEVLFNNVAPMQLEGEIVYSHSATAQGRVGGWPFVNRRFGVQRSSGWAIYAREGVNVEVKMTVDVPPPFPLTVVGAELHGFSLTHADFQRKIVKDWRGMLEDI